MKKNTITTIILALGLCASMTGCGAEKENTPDSAGTGAVAEIKEQKATSEILDADIYSKKVQLGNQVFTLPVALEDIIASGAVVTDTEVHPTDAVYSTQTYTTIKLDIDGFSYSLPFIKTIDIAEETIQLNKAKLDSLMDCKQDLILPKGMKIGMTTEELVSAWGKPSNDVETYPDTYIYKESDESRDIVRFHIDMNTNTIENITINYHKEQ